MQPCYGHSWELAPSPSKTFNHRKCIKIKTKKTEKRERERVPDLEWNDPGVVCACCDCTLTSSACSLPFKMHSLLSPPRPEARAYWNSLDVMWEDARRHIRSYRRRHHLPTAYRKVTGCRRLGREKPSEPSALIQKNIVRESTMLKWEAGDSSYATLIWQLGSGRMWDD